MPQVNWATHAHSDDSVSTRSIPPPSRAVAQRDGKDDALLQLLRCVQRQESEQRDGGGLVAALVEESEPPADMGPRSRLGA